MNWTPTNFAPSMIYLFWEQRVKHGPVLSGKEAVLRSESKHVLVGHWWYLTLISILAYKLELTHSWSAYWNISRPFLSREPEELRPGGSFEARARADIRGGGCHTFNSSILSLSQSTNSRSIIKINSAKQLHAIESASTLTNLNIIPWVWVRGGGCYRLVQRTTKLLLLLNTKDSWMSFHGLMIWRTCVERWILDIGLEMVLGSLIVQPFSPIHCRNRHVDHVNER